MRRCAVVLAMLFVIVACSSEDAAAPDVDETTPAAPDPDTTTTAVIDADPVVDLTWEEADTVIGGDNAPVVQFTGSHVLILNIENWGNDVRGELWDPATNTAEVIDGTGLIWRVGAATAWTGDELLMIGGSNGPGIERPAVAYNPSEDSWRDLATPPGTEQFGVGVVGPGFLIGGNFLLPRNALSYDPEDDVWNDMAPWPYPEDRLVRSLAASDEHIIAWGGCTGAQCDDSNTGLVADGMVFDSRTNTWSPMSDAPLRGSVHNAIVWTGSEFVVVAADEARKPGAAAYDPATDSWRELPAPPNSVASGVSAVVVDNRVVVVGGGQPTGGMVLDLDTSAWDVLPEALFPIRRPSIANTPNGIYISAIRPDTPQANSGPRPQVLHLPSP